MKSLDSLDYVCAIYVNLRDAFDIRFIQMRHPSKINLIYLRCVLLNLGQMSQERRSLEFGAVLTSPRDLKAGRD